MLNRQYAKDGLTDLKYAAITIETKDDSTNAGVYGLLLGYRALMSANNTEHTKTDGLFVWIYKKKCVYLYSLKYYEIRSIEISVGDHGKTVQVTNFKGKQEEAIKSILEIIEALKKQDKIQANDLIDVYKYEALPAELKSDLEETRQTDTSFNNINMSSNRSAVMDLYKNNKSYTSTPTYKPKELETLFMERTSKYSTVEALEKMKEKIEEIKNGTYCAPKLKKLSADKEKNIKEDNDVDDTEDIYGYGYTGL
jgi:hypothetical protein